MAKRIGKWFPKSFYNTPSVAGLFATKPPFARKYASHGEACKRLSFNRLAKRGLLRAFGGRSLRRKGDAIAA